MTNSTPLSCYLMASNVVGRALLIIFTAIFMTYKFPLERNVASKAKNFTLLVVARGLLLGGER